MTNSKALAAARWFGYGRWDAPFWFIGKEPGGADDLEQYDSWLRLDREGTGLIDCREHDLDCAPSEERMLWHGVNGRLQPTWRPLIALLLAYKGAVNYDKAAAWKYQDESWGSKSGETALIELSAIAAPSGAVPEPLRLSNLSERIDAIRQRISAHRPEFVLFYGGGLDPVYGRPYLERWSAIAGVTLEPSVIVRQNGTAYVATPHPTKYGLTTAFWTDLGSQLRTF